MKQDPTWQGFYGLGFIGALIYFIQQSTSFMSGLIGFVKALFWPAVLVYRFFMHFT